MSNTTLYVCDRCLRAIESREGRQEAFMVYDGGYIGLRQILPRGFCDWCGSSHFDQMYIIQNYMDNDEGSNVQ